MSQVAPEMLQLAQNHHQASTLPSFLAKSFNRKPTSIELKRMRERQRAGVPPAKDSYPNLDSRYLTMNPHCQSLLQIGFNAALTT